MARQNANAICNVIDRELCDTKVGSIEPRIGRSTPCASPTPDLVTTTVNDNKPLGDDKESEAPIAETCVQEVINMEKVCGIP